MKSFWALPAALRLAVASRQVFSVQNDLLAFPQYDIVFSESFVAADEARTRIAIQQARDSGDEGKATDIATRSLEGENSTPKDTFEELKLNGTSYLCTIPYVAPTLADNSTSTQGTDEEHQQERERASNHGWELLSNMKGQCIYYPAGWWTYSFCFDDEVKQFHRLPPGGPVPIYPPVEDPNVHSYVLGKYDANSRMPVKGVDGEQRPVSRESIASGKELSSQLQTRGETNYLIQKLGGGTVCDLTNRERAITVQFHCDPHLPEHIHMIKETATCAYLMVVHTPRLCNDVAFRPPEADRPNLIACQEIVEREDVKAWTNRKTHEAKDALFKQSAKDQKEDQAAQPLIVGNIEVGAKKIVGGSPERTIETSNIIKPPKKQAELTERFVATLAKSDGTYLSTMSEREIEKLGLKGRPGDIEDLIDEMESKVREGQPWRLDVYQTREGYEFRGITEEGLGGFGENRGGEPTAEKAAPSGGEKSSQKGSKEEYKDEL